MNKILVIGGQGDVSNSQRYCDDVIQWEPLIIGQMPKFTKPAFLEENKNKWRGGSRGKGGKTKWPRR